LGHGRPWGERIAAHLLAKRMVRIVVIGPPKIKLAEKKKNAKREMHQQSKPA